MPQRTPRQCTRGHLVSALEDTLSVPQRTPCQCTRGHLVSATENISSVSQRAPCQCHRGHLVSATEDTLSVPQRTPCQCHRGHFLSAIEGTPCQCNRGHLGLEASGVRRSILGPVARFSHDKLAWSKILISDINLTRDDVTREYCRKIHGNLLLYVAERVIFSFKSTINQPNQ